MKFNEAKKAHDYYLCGASLSKTAKRYGTTRQRLHYYFKAFGFEVRSLKKKDFIEYKGSKYSKDKNGYYRKTTGDRLHLHKLIWLENGMSLPSEDECLVFKDGNKEYWKFENLKKMKIKDFASSQPFRGNQYTKRI